MTLNLKDQNTIRRYLLGEVTEDGELRLVEERLLTDDEYFEEIAVIEDELIDQYVSGSLSPGEQEKIESHFLATVERRRKLRFAQALRKYVSAAGVATAPRTPRQRFNPLSWASLLFTPYGAVAVAAILLLCVGLVGWRVFLYQSDVNKGLVALKSAYREQRPLEARLSGFDYAPLSETRGNEPGKVDQTSHDRAERILLDAVQDHPGAASYHALGQLYLAERKFDKALAQFEEALKTDPRNARLHSDIGAALLELGKADRQADGSGKNLKELAQSLSHLNQALELDANLHEALFNRALCYEYMLLPQQAGDDWRKYLERDPNSHWADEARRHLRLLEQEKNQNTQNKEQAPQDFLNAYRNGDDETAWRIVSHNHSSAGNLITNTLLDSYLDMEAKGQQDEASGQLQALFHVGQLEIQRTGDRYTSDLVRFYSSAPPKRRAVLVQARSQMKKAYELFTHSRWNDAIASYTAAREIFEQAQDESESAFAQYRIGHCYVLNSDTDKSQIIFQALSPTYESKEYHWLLAQCFYELAQIHVGLSEYTKAIDYSNQALKLSAQLDDTNGVLKSLIQLADEYRSLHNEERSLGFLQRSVISMRDSSPDPGQGWGVYSTIALNFNSLGLYAAALEYQKETLRLALATKRPLLVSRSYQFLGLIYGSLKNYDEAIRNIQQAFEVGKTIESAEIMANASLQMGEIYRQSGDYVKALASYDQSIQIYDGLGFQYFSYPAHKGKLLSYLAQGDDSATEQELQTVLRLFEQYRSRITDESNRNSFFDAEQSIYDLAIDFAYSRMNNPQRAFEYSELSRARSLLDITRQGAEVLDKEAGPALNLQSVSNPLTLSELRQAMPNQAQILQYAVLENKLLIWVINATNISPAVVNISAQALREKVQKYLDLVNNGSATMTAEARESAKDLYDILIKPIVTVLDANELLCIVPDKILNYLPFNALVSPMSGRYLLEDYRLQLSPSSSIFLDCSNRAERKGEPGDERLLSVGNPTFAHASFPTLPDLPAASREATAIISYYKTARLLLGDNARVRPVKSELERSDVAHFATHYVVDARSEMLSKLVLASESTDATAREDGDGVLRAYEIYSMKLPRTRLVILSACQTGIEHQYGGEGGVSLARPFIAAGVPLVIASLWPVDSNSTAELMIAFHKHRKRDRVPTAEALHRAQLDMLHSPDERYRQPYYWASFVAIGGYTEF
jgi:CHAT domain-containing protein/cytochrome c-type biogenesis protein CcmH/NrfG